MNAKILKAVLDTKTENETELRKALTEAGLEGDTLDAAVGLARLRDGFRDSMTDDQIAKVLGMEIEKVDVEKIKADALAEAKAELEKAAKATSAEEKEKAEREALAKASPEVSAKLEALEKAEKASAEKAAKLEKALADEREVRLQKEFVEKASAYLSAGFDPDTFGPVLKSISENCSEEEFKYLTEHLARLSVEVEKSDLFRTLGHNGSGDDDETPEGIAAMKKAELRKAHPEATDAQISKMAFNDPAVKAAYGKRQEERARLAAGQR